ncbi:hypothetical protein M569_06475, partial [Genlisea aurea]
ELVIIPSPGQGHTQPALRLAGLLLDSDHRLSITVLLIPAFYPSDVLRRLPAENSRIRFIAVPPSEFAPSTEAPIYLMRSFIASHRDNVRKEVKKLVEASGSHSVLAGFVVDMFCGSMIDVADEFGVPSYVFYASGASYLGLAFHIGEWQREKKKDLSVLRDSAATISIPSYRNPFPAKLLPPGAFDESSVPIFVQLSADFKRAKGILINTFLELETHGINSFSDGDEFPPVYSIGPLINSGNDDKNPKFLEIKNWLDEQPDSSVIFLCFGSRGWFDREQVEEIAAGLERSGHRFLWSLSKPPPPGTLGSEGDYENFDEILPEGFLRRTAGIGKLIGWAPQIAVLSHRAVGGFVSHCGWNSILESLWAGVPIAAWPMFADQQANAFQLVEDSGLAVEMKLDYHKNIFGHGSSKIVGADEIEASVRKLMDSGSRITAEVQVMKEKSRAALSVNGSSSGYIRSFVDSLV